MQYHYVVMYDSLDKTFTIDVDTADAVFVNDVFFDDKTQSWLHEDDYRTAYYREDYFKVEDKIAKKLAEVNLDD